MNIRAATRDDVPWLLEQLRDFDRFYGTKRSLFPENVAAAEALLVSLIDTQPFFVAVDPASIIWGGAVHRVASVHAESDTTMSIVTAGGATISVPVVELETARVGFIVGALVTHPFNAAIRVLEEVFWWVVPERRGSTAGGRLLDAFEAYGRKKADWVTMTLEAKSPVDPAALERRGFALHERKYLLEVAA